MSTTPRRQFIKLSIAATAAMSIQDIFAEESVKTLRILILGGTGFTGPFQVKYALSRGHKITVFNRGKTHPGELPKEVEQLIGDRNGQLEALKGSGYKTDGPLKALSEQETQKWFPDKSVIIRPGLIVGPRDETDRFTYWPVRIDRGGEVLAPGNPSDPVQFIDGRDLAEWTIRMAEKGETGIYNATGPARELGIGGMLDGIKGALNSNATLTWADAEFLKQQKVEAWSDMPVWAGDELGLSRANISRALAKGLTFRALGDTARDTVAWFKAQKPERQAKMRAGLTLEREAEVLAALHKAAK